MVPQQPEVPSDRSERRDDAEPPSRAEAVVGSARSDWPEGDSAIERRGWSRSFDDIVATASPRQRAAEAPPSPPTSRGVLEDMGRLAVGGVPMASEVGSAIATPTTPAAAAQVPGSMARGRAGGGLSITTSP